MSVPACRSSNCRGGGKQFFDIRQPLLVLFAFGIGQVIAVTGFGQNVPQDFLDRIAGQRRQAIDHCHEAGHDHGRFLRQLRILDQTTFPRAASSSVKRR